MLVEDHISLLLKIRYTFKVRASKHMKMNRMKYILKILIRTSNIFASFLKSMSNSKYLLKTSKYKFFFPTLLFSKMPQIFI